MKKSTFLLLTLAGCMATATANERVERPSNPNPWNIGEISLIENPLCPELASKGNDLSKNLFQTRQTPFMASGEDNEFFVAAQKYSKGWVFAYEGGDIVSYPMTVDVDGDKVTIHGLFNLAAQSTDWAKAEDYDVEGVYDKEAGTITIATIPDQEEGTIVGYTQGGYYLEMLVAGTVDEYGSFDTVDELVFDVIGDFEALTTKTSFGIMNISSSGYIGGFGAIYRKFYATIPQTEPQFISFTENVNVGTQFAGMTKEEPFTVVNVSTSDVVYFVQVESEGNAFSAPMEIGTVSALSSQDINILFAPTEAGEYTANVSLEYEGIESEPQPITLTYEGTAVTMPDFSEIVKEGDFTFGTNIDYPFELITLDNGTRAAKSGLDNMMRGSSQLIVEFEVAETDLATLSWKGEVYIPAMYTAAAGYFIDDNPYSAMAMLESGDFSGELKFGPGKHSIKFQFDGYTTLGEGEHYMYIYDLDLATAHAEAREVALDNPDLNMGNQLIKSDDGIEVFSDIIVRNLGYEPLTITSATAEDSEHFTLQAANWEASLFETLPVTVVFKTKEPGEYSTNVDIVTSDGTVTAKVSVLVRKMADFSQIVGEGLQYITSFETNPEYPFTAEDGMAFNANSGEEDNVATSSWLQINFEIPEGATATLTWEGTVYSEEYDPYDPFAIDYGTITVYNPSYGYYQIYTNEYEGEASSTLFTDIVNGYDIALDFNAGYGYVTFEYVKNGNGTTSDEDLMTISDFCIYVEGTGIDSTNDSDVASRQIYDINGIRHNELQKGINIVRTINADGSVTTRKVIKK